MVTLFKAPYDITPSTLAFVQFVHLILSFIRIRLGVGLVDIILSPITSRDAE